MLLKAIDLIYEVDVVLTFVNDFTIKALGCGLDELIG
jgi:hypothetical protein